jgi:hypothetical protein
MSDTTNPTTPQLPNVDLRAMINSIVDPPTQQTVTGIISEDAYRWAVRIIQKPAEDTGRFSAIPKSIEILDHARWIIDRVQDGTLSLPTIEFTKP